MSHVIEVLREKLKDVQEQGSPYTTIIRKVDTIISSHAAGTPLTDQEFSALKNLGMLRIPETVATEAKRISAATFNAIDRAFVICRPIVSHDDFWFI